MDEIKFRHGMYYIKGEYYEQRFRDGEPYLKKIPKTKIKVQLKLGEEIAEKLYDKIDAKKILLEALMRIDIKEVEKLHRMLFQDKKKYIIKTREHHCVDLKVGNFILPLVD